MDTNETDVDTSTDTPEAVDAAPADTIYDDLLATHTAAVDKITALEAANMQLEADMSKLKAERFDTLMATAAAPAPDNTGGDTDDDSDPDNPNIDDLWEED